MEFELTKKEFRHLLDLVYIGNWILNSIRANDRFEEYDLLQEKFFALAAENGFRALTQRYLGHIFPSTAYEEGGIHDAIAEYEDDVFFDILAEVLAHRDMIAEHLNPDDMTELALRIESYMREFETNGVENISLDNN
ncbi:MAG: hypothetical protein LBM18_02025 [Oscillospiraceae bacterium]|jgi:hypothetical protein|nr:hypothetical protein [Oscillospiraceae bacterium]